MYSYFRGILISGVSLFQRYPYFRGVQNNFRVSLISGASIIISGCPLFQGRPSKRYLISGASIIISGCPLFQGRPSKRYLYQGVPYFRSVFPRGIYFRGTPVEGSTEPHS